MALSPERMAEFIADEMVDELTGITERLEQFHDRYTKLGQQFGPFLNPQKKEWLDESVRLLTARLNACGED